MMFENLPIWRAFVEEYKLTDTQAAQFAQYLKMVNASNELFNLTAITNPADSIAYHFQDSLAISTYIDFNTLQMIADVGTGAGFPGIPLKILFPHLRVMLIEVSHKKREFLHEVIAALNLTEIEVTELDWRTFLRKTQEPINFFVSRASLHTDELMRMFKPSCTYKNSSLAYWASKEWHPTHAEEPYLVADHGYTVKNKHRRIIVFALKNI